jgi:hypothetical protein
MVLMSLKMTKDEIQSLTELANLIHDDDMYITNMSEVGNEDQRIRSDIRMTDRAFELLETFLVDVILRNCGWDTILNECDQFPSIEGLLYTPPDTEVDDIAFDYLCSVGAVEVYEFNEMFSRLLQYILVSEKASVMICATTIINQLDKGDLKREYEFVSFNKKITETKE